MWVDLLSVALRTAALIALFQAAGGSIIVCLFQQHLMAIDLAVRRLTLNAAVAAIVLWVAQYLLEAGRMSGDLAGVMDLDLQRIAAQSSLAVALAWRIGGLALMGIGARVAGRRGDWLALVGAAAAWVAFALTGHTSISDLRPLLSVLLLLHVLLGAFWMGVLPPLYMQLRRNADSARALATDFSRLALWVVPLIPLLGVGLAFGLMDTPAAWMSPYGLLLFGKLTGFGLLMIFAALNKLRLVPSLSAGDGTAARRLRISLGIEYVVIAAVLAVTAILTTFQSPEG